uniref:Uncharacterized protein n=1 Tax=Glossina palpalis gambiensis TaxID=67801 RepID=A0A1B0BWY7_9MUSC
MKLKRRLPLILPHISSYHYELYSTGKNEYMLNIYFSNCSSRDEFITLDDYIDITGYNANFTIELGRRIGCLKSDVLKSAAGYQHTWFKCK